MELILKLLSTLNLISTISRRYVGISVWNMNSGINGGLIEEVKDKNAERNAISLH